MGAQRARSLRRARGRAHQAGLPPARRAGTPPAAWVDRAGLRRRQRGRFDPRGNPGPRRLAHGRQLRPRGRPGPADPAGLRVRQRFPAAAERRALRPTLGKPSPMPCATGRSASPSTPPAGSPTIRACTMPVGSTSRSTAGSRAAGEERPPRAAAPVHVRLRHHALGHRRGAGLDQRGRVDEAPGQGRRVRPGPLHTDGLRLRVLAPEP